MKHFGIVDITDGGNDIIGIVNNIPTTEVGLSSLIRSINNAVTSHLDTDDFNIDELTLQDIKEYKPIELSIEVDGMNYFIEVQQVFFY